MAFRFVDLFAGIGGFHAALSAAGGKCVWASEIDPAAANVYARNWRHNPVGDIRQFTEPLVSDELPDHDVLAAGFPCQPFSKSGRQEGFRDATRGTLFFNICQILEARRPSVVFLENVRNLAGPRQRDTWTTIIRELRNLGYRVSDSPTVFSPHLLPPQLGGAPQIRERVFIVGVHVGRDRAWAESSTATTVENRPVMQWEPRLWDIESILDAEELVDHSTYGISHEQSVWIECWNDFVLSVVGFRNGKPLPGFPLWADEFRARPKLSSDLPTWKADFLRKNSAFYLEHRAVIDEWKSRWSIMKGFPASRRKLEWQAQDTESLWDCVLQLRPSGIRAKRATYLPALVAITQTSILGSRKRAITPNEAKRLQGLPVWFEFGPQRDADSYRQLGNGISVGAAYYVFRQEMRSCHDELKRICPRLAKATASMSEKPDLDRLGSHRNEDNNRK
jgi:DNA (cytosine-5)-methyltransferase 1